MFVCDKADVIDTAEVRLSLFESAESLRISGIRCAVQITETAQIPVAICDDLEAILEATLPGVENLLFCALHSEQG